MLNIMWTLYSIFNLKFVFKKQKILLYDRKPPGIGLLD